MRKIKFKIWDSIANIMYEPFELKDIMVSKKAPNMAEHYIYLQFTGLLDKQGKEIYEEDILNSLYRIDGCKGLYEVVWNDTAFRVKRQGVHQQTEVSITMSDLTRCEVIGNVFENKDLLK